MPNLSFIVKNPELIREGIKKKRTEDVELDKILKLDGERRNLIKQIDSLRERQNTVSKEIPNKKGDEKENLLSEMRDLKEDLKLKEQELNDIESVLNELILKVPNPPLPDVPEGADENDNVVIDTYGTPKKFDFEPKDHVELGKDLDLLDLEKAAEVSGARFYYVKNDLVLLEFALVQYALSKITVKGFKPILPPLLVREKAMFGTGFFPAEMNEIYSVNPDEDNLYLIGTGEVPLCMLHHNEILKAGNLPLRYVAFSACFRREAGSYGRDTHGIIRVHQFDKIEMYSFVYPDKAKEEHELIVSIEEDILQGLNIPYQKMLCCGGELGIPAAKKIDIEGWIPSQGKFRELTSCSNTTDFQSRRSKIRFKEATGKKEYVYNINGTGIAMARMFVAILENYQNKDGSVTIPEVLRPYMGGREVITKE